MFSAFFNLIRALVNASPALAALAAVPKPLNAQEASLAAPPPTNIDARVKPPDCNATQGLAELNKLFSWSSLSTICKFDIPSSLAFSKLPGRKAPY